MKAGLRVDIDCIADIIAVPLLINILGKYDSRATFFITTGEDGTLRNAFHYAGKKIFSLPFKRYCKGFFHSLFNRHVESHHNLKMLLETDHEIGLHGYRHYEWMSSLHAKSKEEITDMISEGCELFEHEFGFKPKSFSSPGFRTTKNYLLALDEFGFDYSSDFFGNKLFYPEIDGKSFKTMQVPVSMLSPGELGVDDSKILMQGKELHKNGYFVFYIHPSYEPIYKRNLFEEILRCTGGSRTLSEIYENPPDI
ncbi:MAG: polysaccharide deacetylase family protein [Candidatus Methanoperedens sp.]|nr:polysaccharide deacetylase family protein [Candidatus Methanoperedens sp.]MCZ7360995.1 polysaccharide deacetylase family protein [Candidatus Methanoperedens sp.]HLB69890.1 polysaccharide deacetylase family protein [Candidatus Methanoperedens sp.]